MIYRFVRDHQRRFPVSAMCQVLGISRSGYYAWTTRPLSARKRDDHRLRKRIKTIHRDSRGTYGSPRIYRQLRHEGDACGRHRVSRLMREDGLKAKVRKRYKTTTDSKHTLPIAPNVLQRDFARRVRTRCGLQISPISGPTRGGSTWP